MEKTNNLIEIRNLTKEYFLAGESFCALNKVSLDVKAQAFISIVGPSGSGKSTLMNIIGLLDQFNSGTYFIDGIDVSILNENDQARIRNEKIGFVFQNFNLLPKLTAFENVELPLIYGGLSKSKRKIKVEQAMERVGLTERMRHRPNQLSGGQQQRVAIARALVTDPPIVLADEPTGALDTKTGTEILRILKELNENGKTIILITHDLAIAKESQQTLRIKDGELTPIEEGRNECIGSH